MTGLLPVAVGYASSPVRVGIGHWTRWHGDIEAVAAGAGMPLLQIITDDHTTSGAGRSRLMDLLRGGQIDVLLVPGIEHLSVDRDGTHGLVRHLMNVHFGVLVQVAPGRRASDHRTDGPVVESEFPAGALRTTAATRADDLTGSRRRRTRRRAPWRSHLLNSQIR